MPQKRVQEIQNVAIRFSGDSGDGMQLTGTKFTESTALATMRLSARVICPSRSASITTSAASPY